MKWVVHHTPGTATRITVYNAYNQFKCFYRGHRREQLALMQLPALVAGGPEIVQKVCSFMSSSPEMSEEALTPNVGMWALSISLGGSLIIHLSALGLLAALLLPAGSPSTTSAITGEFIDTIVGGEGGSFGDDLVFLNGEAISLHSESAENASAESISPAIDLAINSTPLLPPVPQTEMSLVQIPNETVAGSLMTGTLADPLQIGKNGGGKSVGAGSGRGKGAGKGNGKGNGSGTGTGTGEGKGKSGFFGLKVKEKSTVFVVDASRSMNLPHPGPSHTRFNRVKLELVRAISSMTEDEKFFIIFFGDVAYPMPADYMMEATPQVRKRYLGWMTSAMAVGNDTIPDQALQLALQLDPDQIYFLTDGAFRPMVVPAVTAANKKGIPIHSIGFSDNRGENVLLEIARRNNGTYTYIPPDVDGDDEEPGETALSIIAPLGNR